MTRDFAFEEWRPLYVRETLEEQRWPLFTRSLRAYLIKRCERDGRLLKRCVDPVQDLGAAIGSDPGMFEALNTLLADGFLEWNGPESPLYVARLRGTPGAANDTRTTAAEPIDRPETESEKTRRLARERKQRQRDKGRDTSRDFSVTSERDTQRDCHAPLPPTPPNPSERNREKEKDSEGAHVTTRVTHGVTERDNSGRDQRDAVTRDMSREPFELPPDWDPGASVLDLTPATGQHARYLERFRAHHCGSGRSKSESQWRSAYRTWAVRDAQDDRSRQSRNNNPNHQRQPDDASFDVTKYTRKPSAAAASAK